MGRLARSRVAAWRSLHGRQFRGRARLDRRCIGRRARPGPHRHSKMGKTAMVYTAYFRTRKSEGLITRKLSVTESRRASQFRGTSRVRKVIVFVLKSRNVA